MGRSRALTTDLLSLIFSVKFQEKRALPGNLHKNVVERLMVSVAVVAVAVAIVVAVAMVVVVVVAVANCTRHFHSSRTPLVS